MTTKINSQIKPTDLVAEKKNIVLVRKALQYKYKKDLSKLIRIAYQIGKTTPIGIELESSLTSSTLPIDLIVREAKQLNIKDGETTVTTLEISKITENVKSAFNKSVINQTIVNGILQGKTKDGRLLKFNATSSTNLQLEITELSGNKIIVIIKRINIFQSCQQNMEIKTIAQGK